jgi:hypothetical protein
MADKVAKGRQAKGDRIAYRKYPELRRYGEAHYGTYLNEQDVRAMIAAYEGGMTGDQIAKDHNVPRGTVYSILSGRNWKKVGGARRLRAIALSEQIGRMVPWAVNDEGVF